MTKTVLVANYLLKSGNTDGLPIRSDRRAVSIRSGVIIGRQFSFCRRDTSPKILLSLRKFPSPKRIIADDIVSSAVRGSFSSSHFCSMKSRISALDIDFIW